MSRLVVTFGLLSLFLCLPGCRLCDTPHDYRITGYIDRCDDYRGFNPSYRAGSVFNGDQNNACQMVIGDAYYSGSAGDIYSNAGNYGITTPVSLVSRSPRTLPPQTLPPSVDQRTIGVPDADPAERIITEPRRNDTNSVPSVEQLLQQPRGTMPHSLPAIPPEKLRVAPPAFKETHGETIPFSPNDESIVPPSSKPKPMNTEPEIPITLEELRRLDPSVHDLQIISIEDASVGTPVR